MCGIAGILRFDGQPPDRAALEKMRDAIAVRGPDGHGIFIDGPCGLVHTRLAILDPSHGAQPMTADGLTVVFNGEIYNHRDLRSELEKLGYKFTTDHCDTEVLLHGYRAWGTELPTHLDGMFAFAIWDAAKRELFLARDRVGKKPLYTLRTPDGYFFASVPAAIPVFDQHSPNPIGLEYFLGYGYVPGSSLLGNIHELSVHRSTTVTLTGYWGSGETHRYGAEPISRSIRSQLEFNQLIPVAVKKRLESDVPLGCFLSGGIDSSVVAAIAQQELDKRGGRLKTFSVSMPDARYDEGPWAKKVAQHIGAEHHELRAEPDVEKDLQFLIATMGEPLGDSSLLPTYWLSKATRQHVTVALSGDGGDELFGGYDRYQALELISQHGWWLRFLPQIHGGEQKSNRSRWSRFIAASKQKNVARQYMSMIRLFDGKQSAALGRKGILFTDPALDLTPVLSPTEKEPEKPADWARCWDFENYLPFDLLRKVDRASMAVGLEVRCPLLDTAVVEQAMSLPYDVICPSGRPKGLLRDIARRWLPDDVCNRKKMGFAVPIGPWFAGPLKPMIVKWLLDAPYLTEIGLRREGVERFVTEHVSGKVDHAQRLFALLSLSMWREWLKDTIPRPRGEGGRVGEAG